MPFMTSFRTSILNHLFGGDASPVPSQWWLGLSTSTPSIDGTNITEPPGASGYARIPIAVDNTGFTDATGTTTVALSNAALLSFPTATANWPAVTHYVLFQSETGNDPALFGSLDAPTTVNNGTAAEFPANELVFDAT